MATILIPTPLRKYTGNLSKVEVAGGTVLDSFQALVESYPELAKYLLDSEGKISQRIYLYLDQHTEPIANPSEIKLDVDSVLNIVPSIKDESR